MQAYERIVEHQELMSSRIHRLRNELQQSMSPEEIEQILRIEAKRKLNATLTHHNNSLDHYRQTTFNIRDDDSYYVESPVLLMPTASNSAYGSGESAADGTLKATNNTTTVVVQMAHQDSVSALPTQQWSFSNTNASDDYQKQQLRLQAQAQAPPAPPPPATVATANAWNNDVTEDSNFARAHSEDDEVGQWSADCGPGPGEFLLVPVMSLPHSVGGPCDVLMTACGDVCDDRLSPMDDDPSSQQTMGADSTNARPTEINVHELSSRDFELQQQQQTKPRNGNNNINNNTFSFALPTLGDRANYCLPVQGGNAHSPVVCHQPRIHRNSTNNNNSSHQDTPLLLGSWHGSTAERLSCESRTPNTAAVSPAGAVGSPASTKGLRMKQLALDQLALPRLEASSSILRSPLSVKSNSRVRFAEDP